MLEDAASLFPGLPVLDLTDGICRPHTCETVLGNNIVLREAHHLIVTYSAALASYFTLRRCNEISAVNTALFRVC